MNIIYTKKMFSRKIVEAKLLFTETFFISRLTFASEIIMTKARWSFFHKWHEQDEGSEEKTLIIFALK